jgi:hypothetical protein
MRFGMPASVSDDGESIHVHYPTVFACAKGYLRDHVLVEFGGRNIIDPNAVHSIQQDITELFKSITFPKAEKVLVLSPTRTLCEKVTLIHAQCNKPIPEGKHPISRHWYDLAMLLQHDVGASNQRWGLHFWDIVKRLRRGVPQGGFYSGYPPGGNRAYYRARSRERRAGCGYAAAKLATQCSR